MTLAGPVDIRVNPSNASQRYVLWGNGRIDAIGGVPPITSGPSWYHRTDQPVAVALHISNWATGAGQLLDFQGAFHPLNGATQYMDNTGPDPVNTLGLVYDYKRRYVGWSWDSSGAALGYVIDGYGQLFPFGGATVPTRGGPRFGNWAVRGFAMSWAGGVKRAYTLDNAGAVWTDFSAVTPSPAPPYYRGQDVARFLAITDYTLGKGYTLTGDGAVHAFGGATASGVAGPYRAGRDVARTLYVVSASDPVRFWQVHSGGEQFEYYNSTPPTVIAGGGQSEAQTVTITGAPTAGTFTLTYSGQTTAAIARTAAASAVQSALEALSNIGVGDVTVTGGPLPATVTVTFAATMARQDLAQMTATSSLTGGTSPAVVIATTTPGVAASPALTTTDTTRPVLSWNTSDPEGDSQAEWQLLVFTQAFVSGHTMTDPAVWASSAVVNESGVNPTTRGIESPVDLPNTSYVEYVRVKDTSGLWSSWSSWAWTQNITPPATPTGLTATVNNTTREVALSVAATAGTYVRFEWSEDAGVTWTLVRGAEQVTRIATTLATDRDPSLGVARTYRAIAYSTSPRTASVASSTAGPVTVTALTYMLRSVSNSALGGEFGVQGPSGWGRPVVAGVFQGLGTKYATVLDDGEPKAQRMTLHIITENRADWDRVKALVVAGGTFVYRDPFGEVVYCRLIEEWRRDQLEAAPLLTESTPLRHAHTTDLPLVEVTPPILVV